MGLRQRRSERLAKALERREVDSRSRHWGLALLSIHEARLESARVSDPLEWHGVPRVACLQLGVWYVWPVGHRANDLASSRARFLPAPSPRHSEPEP